MSSSPKADYLIPGGLLVLSFVPVVAGTFRVAQLAGGAEITPDNARFFAAPLPVVLHIVSSVIYCIVGAFQFAPGFRRRRPQWVISRASQRESAASEVGDVVPQKRPAALVSNG